MWWKKESSKIQKQSRCWQTVVPSSSSATSCVGQKQQTGSWFSIWTTVGIYIITVSVVLGRLPKLNHDTLRCFSGTFVYLNNADYFPKVTGRCLNSFGTKIGYCCVDRLSRDKWQQWSAYLSLPCHTPAGFTRPQHKGNWTTLVQRCLKTLVQWPNLAYTVIIF